MAVMGRVLEEQMPQESWNMGRMDGLQGDARQVGLELCSPANNFTGRMTLFLGCVSDDFGLSRGFRW